ncbi:hypothetical protein L9F63_015197 [Diploptera punctata]|uniref:Uncharacterized protein n=1 Tax=Diploptera punctata TaxID=6984 RepID=A0AAD8A757_DIPPU|nr:hypothetical protein L9F63_015197 [Diploptera punctata]
MTGHLLLIFALLRMSTALPDLDDNMLPTDEEILRTILQQEKNSREREKGQPEVEDSLGLPSDEDSYNDLLIALGLPGGSGTHHFVSSTFPEIDARGFHESVFDGVGDYYPPWGRQKRDPLGINSRGFHDDVFNRDFGTFHTVKRSSTKHISSDKVDAILNKIITSTQRKKRDTKEKIEEENQKETNDSRSPKFRRDISNSDLEEASEKRRPEMDGSGFHGDTFHGGFGDFWPMKKNAQNSTTPHNYWTLHKRRLGMGPSGFHGDTFYKWIR